MQYNSRHRLPWTESCAAASTDCSKPLPLCTSVRRLAAGARGLMLAWQGTEDAGRRPPLRRLAAGEPPSGATPCKPSAVDRTSAGSALALSIDHWARSAPAAAKERERMLPSKAASCCLQIIAGSSRMCAADR